MKQIKVGDVLNSYRYGRLLMSPRTVSKITKKGIKVAGDVFFKLNENGEYVNGSIKLINDYVEGENHNEIIEYQKVMGKTFKTSVNDLIKIRREKSLNKILN